MKRLALVLFVLFIGCGQETKNDTTLLTNEGAEVSETTPIPTPDFNYGTHIESWKELKPIYIEAAVEMVRTSAGGWPEDYFPEVKTFQEKAEIIFWWLLAVDGSYSDCIVPGLGQYMSLYENEILSAPNDQKRAELFEQEVLSLILIFNTLDTQIVVGEKFYSKFEKDFSEYIYKFGEIESIKYWELRREFIENSPKYSGVWPGFISTEVARRVEVENRSWSKFHDMEVKELSKIKIPDRLSEDEYFKNKENFPGVLKDAQWYM